MIIWVLEFHPTKKYKSIIYHLNCAGFAWWFGHINNCYKESFIENGLKWKDCRTCVHTKANGF